jgi:hypothetical protein
MPLTHDHQYSYKGYKFQPSFIIGYLLAFDIERDGSVATLSIPGDIIIVNGKNILQGLTLCTYTTGA